MLGVLLHQHGGVVAVVVRIGLAVGHPALTHDEDVVAKAERIGVHCNGAKVDIGVVTRGLAGGRAIKVPFREVLNRLRLLLQGL